MVRSAIISAVLLASADGLRMDAAKADVKAGNLEPVERCRWRTQYPEDLCQWLRRDVALNDYFKSMRVPRWGIKNITALKQAVWSRLRFDPQLRNDFFDQWRVIFDWQAADMFAFKETWTFRDTDHMAQISKHTPFMKVDETGNLVERPITDALAISRLPKYKDFKRMLHLGDIAMVSNGDGVGKKKLGGEIDDHLQVVRFNSLNTTQLNSETTGLKHNVHVINSKMPARQDAFVFDLERKNFLRSYCQRFYAGGDFLQKTNNSLLFMWTPTAWCKAHSGGNSKLFEMFSPEFLYWWFVGSLTNDVSLYGFIKPKSAQQHFNAPRFQKAEQIVFDEVAKQWQASRTAHPEQIALNRRGKATAGLAIRS